MEELRFREEIGKSAVLFRLGGFRPSGEPKESYFGKVMVGAPGEEWPRAFGEEMAGLAQFDISAFQLDGPLADVGFLALFVQKAGLDFGEELQSQFVVRTYPKGVELVPYPNPVKSEAWKQFPMLPVWLEMDFPMESDCPAAIPDEWVPDYVHRFPHAEGIKLGGWPTSLQHSAFELVDAQLGFQFAFQLDGNVTAKANFYLGEAGLLHFASKGIGSEREWKVEWQAL